MIIELRKYNEIRKILIENRSAGLLAQVSYRDVFQGASVTRAAVHMGVKDMGMLTGHRGTYKQPPSRDREQVCMQLLQSNQKSLSMLQDGNRLGEKRVGALRSQVRQLSCLITRSEGSHVTQGHGGVF